MSNINANARFGRQPLPPQKQQKPAAEDTLPAQNKMGPTKADIQVSDGINHASGGDSDPVVPDPGTWGGGNGVPPTDPYTHINFYGNGMPFIYDPKPSIKNKAHSVHIGGNDNKVSVETGLKNDVVYLGPIPSEFAPLRSELSSHGNQWNVSTEAGDDLVVILEGDDNTAFINTGLDNDNISVALASMMTNGSGNVYNLDGDLGIDTLSLGALNENTDFSLITSKQLADGSWELTVPPANGGTPNIIKLSNIESVSWRTLPNNPTGPQPGGGGPTPIHQMSLSEFIAMTTPA